MGFSKEMYMQAQQELDNWKNTKTPLPSLPPDTKPHAKKAVKAKKK